MDGKVTQSHLPTFSLHTMLFNELNGQGLWDWVWQHSIKNTDVMQISILLPRMLPPNSCQSLTRRDRGNLANAVMGDGEAFGYLN